MPDYSFIDVCNYALTRLGCDRITSFDDNTPESRACQSCYDTLLDEALRSWAWKFATVTTLLTADADYAAARVIASAAAQTLVGRDNKFPLPADLLYLLPPYPEKEFYRRDWQIEQQAIYSNDATQPEIRYIKRETNANVMTPDFRKGLSLKLAAHMCEQFTNSTAKKQTLLAEEQQAWREAKSTDATEGPPTDLDPGDNDSWLQARF